METIRLIWGKFGLTMANQGQPGHIQDQLGLIAANLGLIKVQVGQLSQMEANDMPQGGQSGPIMANRG